MNPIQPAGNYYDKYNTRNPIARWLMDGFFSSFDQLLNRTGNPLSALEAGCGEGELSIRVARSTQAIIRAFDISSDVVREARTRVAAANMADRISLYTSSIYELKPESDAADLVICCEVLEHLEEPGKALEKLAGVCRQHLIISVPREPMWRAMNMARGKYLPNFGNTPGHIQHWSTSAFRKLIEAQFDVLELRQPLPWTMALCRPRRPNEA